MTILTDRSWEPLDPHRSHPHIRIYIRITRRAWNNALTGGLAPPASREAFDESRNNEILIMTAWNRAAWACDRFACLGVVVIPLDPLYFTSMRTFLNLSIRYNVPPRKDSERIFSPSEVFSPPQREALCADVASTSVDAISLYCDVSMLRQM